MPQTLHLPPFHRCLKGFKSPILGDFDLRTPQNWGAGGRFGRQFGPFRTASYTTKLLKFDFVLNSQYLLTMSNKGLGFRIYIFGKSSISQRCW